MKRYLDDIFLIAGYVLLVYGVAQYSGPAGWIVAGFCFVSLAYIAAKKAGGD